MKSLIISFVAALAIGTGGATGVAIQRNKAAAIIQAKVDSVKADSVKAAADSAKVPERVIEDPNDSTAHHDSTAVHADSVKAPVAGHIAAAIPTAVPAAVPAHTTPLPSGPVTAPAAAPIAKQQGAAVSSTPSKGDSVVATLSEKRIAKAFASMPAKDAAKVFEVMSDADVSLILAALSDKESAAILAKLPPQRVAAIISRAGRAHGVTK
jgi:hypothetical protein